MTPAHRQDPWSNMPGPEDILRAELPNGMVVLARANFNSPSVVISGYLRGGGLQDPDDKLGLADFTASMLMHGTENRTFQEIYDQLESVGAGLGFDSGTHTTGFGGRSLAEDLDLLLGLLSDALLRPAFPPEHIERMRAQFLTGLAIRAQDTGDQASMAFDDLVYAGHPYCRPEDGYPETIRAITREDLVDFHHQNYGPQGCVISIVGGVDPQVVVEKAARTLGDWHNPNGAPLDGLPPLTPLHKTERKQVTIPGKSQTDLVIGAAGPARRDPDYLAASLGNNILGQFGMYGRIGEAVRNKAGLAYYAYSGLAGGEGPGPWDVIAGVNPQNLEQAVELITAEIRRFVTEPPGEDELEDTKSNYIGRLPLALESNGGVAGMLVSLERYGLGLDYLRRYPELVRAVTPEAVRQAAQRFLDPDRLAIASAGP